MNGYLSAAVPYLLSILVSAGGGGVVAWLIIKSFGDKWLESKFAESLESFKHGKNKELENLRFEIAALMDRTVKLHQREFDVLPEAWGLLNDAFAIISPVALGVGNAPDFRKMSAEEFEYVLSKIPFEEFQKNELRNSKDQSRYYLDTIQWHDFNKAKEACAAFHFYLNKNGVFILPSIKKKFSDFDDILSDVLMERSMPTKRHSPLHQHVR